MTKWEQMKEMSAAEVADMIVTDAEKEYFHDPSCPPVQSNCTGDITCQECWRRYLESEV